MVEDKETRVPAPEMAGRIQSEALRQHVMVCCGGIERDRIKFVLPLWIERRDIDMIVARLYSIVKSAVAAS